MLDGFPRTVDQAKAAYTVAHRLGANVQIAVHLDVPRDELVRRLLARGRGADDNADVIQRRLQVYEQSTLPMFDYYIVREPLITADGAQPMKAVLSSLLDRRSGARAPVVGLSGMWHRVSGNEVRYRCRIRHTFGFGRGVASNFAQFRRPTTA